MLETERRDEMVAAGRRFRVVRADQFCRYSGLAGPEPPPSADTDSESGPADRPGKDLPTGGLLGQGKLPGRALLGERWEVVPEGPMVPPAVTRDARQALVTHPEIVMLPGRFAVAENTGQAWPLVSGPVASPRKARLTLATYFTTMDPARLQYSSQELAAYQDAARRRDCWSENGAVS